jgi:hypothetical protein
MMPLDLRQTTRAVLQIVEAQTGRPVQVVPDETLQTYAAVQMARGDDPAHFIRYKPVLEEAPDYLICFQCGFILRKFAVPLVERLDFAEAKKGRDSTRRLFLDGVGKKLKLGSRQLEPLIGQILSGVLVHLLSIPVGMRVGAWLKADHPELAELQTRYVLREIKMNRETMSPQIKQMLPSRIYNTSHTLNAAFALFWSELLGKLDIAEPWLPKYQDDAMELLGIWNDTADDPRLDTALIDRWAERLGVAGWYQWIPFRGAR